MALETVSLSIGMLLGEHGKGALNRDKRLIIRGWNAEGSVDGRLPLHRGPVTEPGEGAHLQGNVRGSGRRVPDMHHLSLWELC